MKHVSVGVRKHWFLWVFRGSALLHFVTVLFVMFVLFQLSQGSWLRRFRFMQANEVLVTISWISILIAVLSILAVFTILLFTLDRQYRVILQWGWFIQLMGSLSLFIHVFIQMFVYPLLMKMAWETTNPLLFHHLDDWEHLLVPAISVFVPSCWAVGGLIYTAVMFRSSGLSRLLHWWSLLVWVMVLTGAVLVRWVGSAVVFWQGAAILLFVPWLWYAAEDMNPIGNEMD
ncbi:hypothetical protein [Thermoactinomyces vulgaris]|jgi:hypothetical protein|uniref:hypothetical protein n=1 Tax=Thermoactinomyces vulgaris TaxID=2026 RepID=UPI0011079583|nr:hypothetical protein [Thermoactinomyces vulgaris]QCV56423.1 hypothetical protein FA954_12810 [Thermoactinomyces vulgaris]